MRDDPSVIDLVIRARDGDKSAWDELVERYSPLVWSICRRFRIADLDIDDVGQTVWLRLLEQLPLLRQPAALPGWLATTTRRECLRIRGLAGQQERQRTSVEPADWADQDAASVDEQLLDEERDAVLREAFRQLPARCQQLLSMLIQDPPVPYGEISARLGIPVGGIGPTRARCLRKLRRRPVLAALLESQNETAGRDKGHE
jgi:RNA polymerase sigma factor (sigma-70 family)